MHEAIMAVTESNDVYAGKGMIRRSLPLNCWPQADRNAWNAACQPSTRLRRGGAAGHLRPITRDDYALHYGCFLGFLDRCGLLRSDGPAAANVTANNINAYLADLKGRVGSVRVHGSICTLRRVAQYSAPGRDFTWLSEIGKDLALAAVPRSKFDRVVLTEVLVEAGLTLIHEAEHSSKMTKLARANQVRNGLMVALLALCPIRRKNFAALEIGRSFVNIHGAWWIVLSASETKENRADERPIDELLIPLIDRYLGQHRPVLARSGNPPPALWLSAKCGVPITAKEVANVIRATTLATVGVAVCPHLFRTAAASSAAIHAGANPYLGSAVLHHTDPTVTNDHYNRATSLRAAESFRQIVRQYEKTSTQPAVGAVNRTIAQR
jgi:integrase